MNSYIENLLEDFISNSAENGDLTALTDNLTVGFVVDNDDPLEMGRLRVFVPAYNDDPKKLQHLPFCSYVSPSSGVVSQTAYARGHLPGSESSDGPVHYGFWDIPEIGAHVIVACINGDSRRRIYLGCLPSHQETHTLGNGRYKHSDGAVDGPLTSTGNPIEPTYTKLQEAFGGETNSPEWKTRGADYQITAIRDVPSPEKSLYLDDDLETITNNEEDEWVKEILGEHGYDWTGYKNLGAFLASRVRTWTTPGLHSITMDDRPYNSRIRIRTVGGNQIILDDTNERMYMSTSGGKSWLEMDAAGNIDVYAERRMSIHAEKDLNFSAGESIRLKANNFISMYAGNQTGQNPLTEELGQGEIRIQSAGETHLKTGDNFRYNIDGRMLGYVAENYELDVGQAVVMQAADFIDIKAGSLIRTDSQNLHFRVSGKDTTVNDFVDFLDEFIADHNDLVSKYNSHTHQYNPGPSPLTDTTGPTPTDAAAPAINDEGLSANLPPFPDGTEEAPWTNRVPQHEPWTRVLMQDSDDSVNTENSGYKNNIDWVEQFDNIGEEGREPIGKTEGDETIERGRFWRR